MINSITHDGPQIYILLAMSITGFFAIFVIKSSMPSFFNTCLKWFEDDEESNPLNDNPELDHCKSLIARWKTGTLTNVLLCFLVIMFSLLFRLLITKYINVNIDVELTTIKVTDYTVIISIAIIMINCLKLFFDYVPFLKSIHTCCIDKLKK